MSSYYPLPNDGRVTVHRRGTYEYRGGAEERLALLELLRAARDRCPHPNTVLLGHGGEWNAWNHLVRRLIDGGKEDWAAVRARANAP